MSVPATGSHATTPRHAGADWNDHHRHLPRLRLSEVRSRPMCLLCPSASNERGPSASNERGSCVRVDAWSGTATFQSGAGIEESANETETRRVQSSPADRIELLSLFAALRAWRGRSRNSVRQFGPPSAPLVVGRTLAVSARSCEVTGCARRLVGDSRPRRGCVERLLM
jgi:hypothetical protein